MQGFCDINKYHVDVVGSALNIASLLQFISEDINNVGEEDRDEPKDRSFPDAR
jgi:hypothetical protein